MQERFGAWLRERRVQLGLTRRSLARRVQCSEVTLQKYEYGERSPTRDVFDLLARTLRVPDDQLEPLWQAARQNTAGQAQLMERGRRRLAVGMSAWARRTPPSVGRTRPPGA